MVDTHSTVFCARLYEARRKRKLSRRALGELVGVHLSTIARWEKPGSEMPPVIQLIALADQLEVAVRWLTGSTDNQEPPLFVTGQEKILVSIFRSLDDNGRSALLETIREAASLLKKAQCQAK